MNQIILIGNLCKDPELKYLPNGGTAVANYSLAVSNPFKKGEDGKPTADFINVITFGKAAESLANHMRKGCKLAVEGRLQVRSWKDQEGKTRYNTEVVTNHVEFLSFPKDSEQSNNSPSYEGFHSTDSDDSIPF